MGKGFGLAVSLLIHLVILSIPFSMTAKKALRDLEIFVISEEMKKPMIVKKENLKRSKESKPALKEIRPIEEKISHQEKNNADAPKIEEKPLPAHPLKKRPTPIAERIDAPVLIIQDESEIQGARAIEKASEIQQVSSSTLHPSDGTVKDPKMDNSSSLYLHPLKEKTSTLHDVWFGTEVGPKFLHKELPVYPTFARRLGKRGESYFEVHH